MLLIYYNFWYEEIVVVRLLQDKQEKYYENAGLFGENIFYYCYSCCHWMVF